MRQIRRHTSTPFPRIFLKNPARWAEPPGQARTRSPSQFPGHTAIGTKALGLLFLRRKVASVISVGALTAVGTGNSVITPAVVIRPILLPTCSANHSAPSGPVVMPAGVPPAVGIGNSVITPAVVMRPILLLKASVNHSAPSGPVVIS